MHNPYKTYSERLEEIKKNDLLRSFKDIDNRQDKTITYKHKSCLNLSSNDYLGLATDAVLCKEFYSRMDKENMINEYGLGSSSSRLLTGNSGLYEALEKRFCEFYGSKAALVFNSGYHANIGIIPALAGKNDLILSDSLNHASIVDGIRLSKARCMIFQHNDMDQLRRLLEKEKNGFDNTLIITESIFSMDGDRADIKELVALKEKHNALLYVDEAHSAGVFGSHGRGLSFEAGVHDRVDILLGTMGKAFASHGAYAITHPTLKSCLVNTMRPLLYSTALPPVAVNWNLFILNRMQYWDDRRKQLSRVSEQFRNALTKKGLVHTGDTHIIPVITGSNKKAVELSDLLIENGYLAFPIRPPTVPENNSRIRFSLTSDISFEDIEPVADIIAQYMKNQGS
ncbi:aminotransferase class I/II-fold pyridoxal phosphate-dependent enzyme [Desulfobacula toluolica]|uniref:8-amino-7-oxononanoate synthase n=1 Tax=Desulfobacula toluolica (strain DSM 7467 / Tol2) TaxID=651182 RepID=K0NC02_DESTT|nr:8-amino-7-oxononanoate synthase [Desulfobacula toluolica]CCK81974.1 BioF: 8-amino-7-oxononanoate synthase [Desulfobacula toluolica Tol2]